MHYKRSNKILSVVLAAVMAITPLSAGLVPAVAADTTASEPESTTAPQMTEEEKREEARKKLEAQIAVLDADLKAAEQRLAALAADSKNTEEYINALDEKIGIINQQLTVLDEQVLEYEEDIKVLQTSIEENQKQADTLQAEVDKVQAELDDLNEKFMAKYDAYCLRMRAIYISGNYNLLTALLTCSDISSFLTRYEMIKAVSKSDAQLLQEIQEQTEQILARESDLNEKKTALDAMNMTLLSQQNELKYKQDSLTQAQ